jgi:hypothetical protein
VVKANYSDGTSQTVNISVSNVSGFDSSTEGTKTITVNYGGKIATFEVTVVNEDGTTLTGITITNQPNKTSYEIGDSLDLTGLVVTASYDNNSSKTVNISASNVSGFNSSTAGTKTITVNYGGFTDTFTIVVEAVKTLTGIRITSLPYTTLYDIGDSLNISGMEVTADYNDGTSQTVNITTSNVSGFDSSTAGTKLLTVTYNGFTAPLTVMVNEAGKNLSRIEITTPPYKATYNIGESLDITGMVVMAYYDDDTSQTISISAGNVTGFNSSTSGTKYLYVNLGGLSDYFTVTIIPDSYISIDFNGPQEIELGSYTYGGAFYFEVYADYRYNSFRWILDGVERYETSSSITINWLAVGPHRVTVIASDDTGAVYSQEIVFRING